MSSATVSLDGSAPVSVLKDLNADEVFTLPLATLFTLAKKKLTDGIHTIVIKATDEYGNVGQPFTLTFALKDTPPPTPSQPALVLANGSLQTKGSINTKSLTISVSDGLPNLVALYRNTASGPVEVESALVQANVPVQFPVDMSLLADGTYSFYAVAADLVGNTSCQVAAPDDYH